MNSDFYQEPTNWIGNGDAESPITIILTITCSVPDMTGYSTVTNFSRTYARFYALPFCTLSRNGHYNYEFLKDLKLKYSVGRYRLPVVLEWLRHICKTRRLFHR